MIYLFFNFLNRIVEQLSKFFFRDCWTNG